MRGSGPIPLEDRNIFLHHQNSAGHSWFVGVEGAWQMHDVNQERGPKKLGHGRESLMKMVGNIQSIQKVTANSRRDENDDT